MEKNTVQNHNIGLNTLQEMSLLKAHLMELADVLLHDKVITNEEIALDLLANINALNVIEDDLSVLYTKTTFKYLYKRCEKYSEENRKKEVVSDIFKAAEEGYPTLDEAREKVLKRETDFEN